VDSGSEWGVGAARGLAADPGGTGVAAAVLAVADSQQSEPPVEGAGAERAGREWHH
jgi:hypothetical protein